MGFLLGVLIQFLATSVILDKRRVHSVLRQLLPTRVDLATRV